MQRFEVSLIRHGAAAAGWAEAKDPGLSDAGRIHADEVADHFRARSPLRLVSSPLRRAQETALPLAAHWGTEIEIDNRVREIPSTVAMAERHAWLARIMRSRWDEVDDTLLTWRAEALTAIRSFGVDTLVFTHFMVINTLVALATNDNRLVSFEPDYGSVTTLRITGADCALVTLGKARQTLVL